MQLGARHACINYQSNVECDSQMGEGETGWFSSTPPMHWFGIQTVPLLFPAVLVGLPGREMKTKLAMMTTKKNKGTISVTLDIQEHLSQKDAVQ